MLGGIMDTVYLVSAGEYSDYRILRVFSTEEEADAFAKWFYEVNHHGYGSDARVEPMGIDTWDVTTPTDRKPFNVYIDMWGDADVYRGFAHDTEDIKPTTAIIHSDRRENTLKLFVSVWAKDEGHAAKIANEKRARIVANGLWKEGYSE
jgi:hypothetical protein